MSNVLFILAHTWESPKTPVMALQASISLIWLFWMRQAGLGTQLSGKHQPTQASCQGQKKEVPHHKHTADNKSEEYRPSSFFTFINFPFEGRWVLWAGKPRNTFLTNVTLDIWINDYVTWTFFFFFPATLHSLRDPSSPIKDPTWPGSENAES